MTNIHLCGLKLKESAYSTPFIRYLYSGQMKEDPKKKKNCSYHRAHYATFIAFLDNESIVINI